MHLLELSIIDRLQTQQEKGYEIPIYGSST